MDPATIRAFIGSTVLAALFTAVATVVSQMPSRRTARVTEAKDRRDELAALRQRCEDAEARADRERERRREAEEKLAEKDLSCAKHGRICEKDPLIQIVKD